MRAPAVDASVRTVAAGAGEVGVESPARIPTGGGPRAALMAPLLGRRRRLVHQPDLCEGGKAGYRLDKGVCTGIGRVFSQSELARLDDEGRGSCWFLRDSRLRVAELDQVFRLELIALDQRDDVGRDPGEAASDREGRRLTESGLTSRGVCRRCCWLGEGQGLRLGLQSLLNGLGEVRGVRCLQGVEELAEPGVQLALKVA